MNQRGSCPNKGRWVRLSDTDYVLLPPGIVAAIDRSPRYPLQVPKALRPKPKAFANPYSFGYGGGETPWPFDRRRAYTDPRYRVGIRNAILADWTASNWKFAAKRLLIEVLEDLIAAEEIFN